jgi:hypothetical protein
MQSHSVCSFSAPAAEKIAPQTPPPILSAGFAALTIASTSILVILFLIILSGIIEPPLASVFNRGIQ